MNFEKFGEKNRKKKYLLVILFLLRNIQRYALPVYPLHKEYKRGKVPHQSTTFCDPKIVWPISTDFDNTTWNLFHPTQKSKVFLSGKFLYPEAFFAHIGHNGTWKKKYEKLLENRKIGKYQKSENSKNSENSEKLGKKRKIENHKVINYENYEKS